MALAKVLSDQDPHSDDLSWTWDGRLLGFRPSVAWKEFCHGAPVDQPFFGNVGYPIETKYGSNYSSSLNFLRFWLV